MVYFRKSSTRISEHTSKGSSKKVEYFMMTKGLLKQAGNKTFKRKTKPLVFKADSR